MCKAANTTGALPPGSTELPTADNPRIRHDCSTNVVVLATFGLRARPRYTHPAISAWWCVYYMQMAALKKLSFAR